MFLAHRPWSGHFVRQSLRRSHYDLPLAGERIIKNAGRHADSYDRAGDECESQGIGPADIAVFLPRSPVDRGARAEAGDHARGQCEQHDDEEEAEWPTRTWRIHRVTIVSWW